MNPDDHLQLVLFESHPNAARQAVNAGVDAVIIDWEWRGKQGRQRGADTEINRGTPDDLRGLRDVEIAQRWCRLNGFGPWTATEVEAALAAGATDLLLPMVRSADEVRQWLATVGGRARCGILVETVDALNSLRELAALPLSRVYVGLNDLAIERHSASLFASLTDGTVDRVREAFHDVDFGVGGATVVDGGLPIPCPLLLGELSRLRCTFTFLRRSFRRDIRGRNQAAEIARIRDLWQRLRQRPPEAIATDRASLLAACPDISCHQSIAGP